MQPHPLPPDPRRHARRAGWLMLALGLGALAMAAASFLLAEALPSMRTMPEFREMFEKMRDFEAGGVDLQRQFYVGAAMLTLYALASIVLAVIVRRATRGPVTAALVVTGVTLGMLALNLIGGIMAGNVAALLMVAVVTGLHVLLMNWLLAARRSVPLVERGAPSTFSAAAHLPPAAATSTAPMAGYYAQLPPPPRQPDPPRQ
ncbi:MAG TPA: hypothetical protein VF624_02145 [Tepidisphaeraceae bacterium]